MKFAVHHRFFITLLSSECSGQSCATSQSLQSIYCSRTHKYGNGSSLGTLKRASIKCAEMQTGLCLCLHTTKTAFTTTTHLILQSLKKSQYNLLIVFFLACVFLSLNIIYGPVHEISNNLVCANSKASDQPAHTRSLIRAFASRLSIL